MFCCWYFSLPFPTFTALWETWLRVGLLVEVQKLLPFQILKCNARMH